MTGQQTPHTLSYDREALIEVLIYHGRKDIGGCYCGWSELGKSHAEHVATMYEQTPVHIHGPEKCCARHRHHVMPHRGCVLR